MNLTPEQQELGRRNFLRVLAGTPALAALGVAAAVKGPVRGGPVRLGFIGTGGQGRVLLEQTDPRYAEVVALCDINPLQLKKADASLVKTGRQPVKHYADWKQMIQQEKLEAVVIASPLFTHTDIAVGCMEAGLHAQQNAGRAVERLTRLLTDLRKLADLDERPIERYAVDVPDLLEDVVEAARTIPAYAGRNISLLIPKVPSPFPTITGDRDLIVLAVYNLVENALKFTARNDSVEVRALEDGRAVVIEVADSGGGIPCGRRIQNFR